MTANTKDESKSRKSDEKKGTGNQGFASMPKEQVREIGREVESIAMIMMLRIKPKAPPESLTRLEKFHFSRFSHFQVYDLVA